MDHLLPQEEEENFQAPAQISHDNGMFNMVILVVLGVFLLSAAWYASNPYWHFSNNNPPKRSTNSQSTSSTHTISVSSINRYGYVNVESQANVRSGPGKQYAPIGKFNRGDKAYLLYQDRQSKWYQLNFTNTNGNSTKGWISNTLIQFTPIEEVKPISPNAKPQSTPTKPQSPPVKPSKEKLTYNVKSIEWVPPTENGYPSADGVYLEGTKINLTSYPWNGTGLMGSENLLEDDIPKISRYGKLIVYSSTPLDEHTYEIYDSAERNKDGQYKGKWQRIVRINRIAPPFYELTFQNLNPSICHLFNRKTKRGYLLKVVR